MKSLFYGLTINDRIIELGEYTDINNVLKDNSNEYIIYVFNQDMLEKTKKSIIQATDNGEITSKVFGFTYDGEVEELPELDSLYDIDEEDENLDKYFIFFSNEQISTIFYDIKKII